MMLASGLLGAGTALRQVLQHIAPGDAGYGAPLLGVHFYTWAFVAFAASILYVAFLLFMEAREEVPARRAGGPRLLERLALWLFVLVVGANLVSTLLECGFGACAHNPTFYEWLGPRPEVAFDPLPAPFASAIPWADRPLPIKHWKLTGAPAIFPALFGVIFGRRLA
jgi:hypothetical protein